MNRARRNKLNTAIKQIADAAIIVTTAREEEDDCLRNLPDNLESSDMYCRMEDAVDLLDDALDSIDEALQSIREAIE